MSRRQPRSNLTVSLFPFLAVLICAMGALIFLLIVTTQMMGDEAPQPTPLATAVPAPAPLPPDPAVDVAGYLLPNLDDLESAAEFLGASREEDHLPAPAKISAAPRPDPNRQLQFAVNRLRRERARVRRKFEEREAELQKAKQNLAAANRVLQQQQRELKKLQAKHHQAVDQDQKFRTERRRLRLRIKGAKKRIAELRQRQSTVSSKFALVPYDGQRGTTRRPIFIECTEKGVYIWPEGVFLGPNKLEGFTESLNPLLAGTRALMDYWNNQTQWVNADSPGEPYVLLVVRPRGSIAYYLSKKFLAELGQPYGYELVEDDFAWYLPQPDPAAKRVLEQAIEATLKERRNIVRTYSLGGDTHDLSKFPDLDEQRAENDLPFASSTSNASRFARKRQLQRTRVAKQHHDAEALGAPSNHGIAERSPGKTGRSPGVSGRGYASGESDGGGGLQGERGFRSRSQESGQMFGKGQNGLNRDRPRRSFAANAGSKEPGKTFDQFPSGPPGRASRRFSFDVTNTGQNPGEFANQNGSGEQEYEPPPLSAAQRGDSRPRNWKPTETAVARFSDFDRLAAEEKQNFGNRPGTASRSSRPQAHGQRHGSRKTGSDSSSSSEFSSSEFSNSEFSNSKFSPGATASNGPPGMAGQPKLPSLLLNHSSKPPKRRDSLAKRGWGVSRRRSGIGIEQKVVVDVSTRRIKVGDRKTSIALGHGETKQQLFRAVVVDLDELAKTWGEPPTGFYWVPSVRFRVHPGAARIYETLERPLKDGGLSTYVVFLQHESTDAESTDAESTDAESTDAESTDAESTDAESTDAESTDDATQETPR